MKLTENEFRNLLDTSHVAVVADFFATWCGPCRALAPIFEKVASKMGNDLKFAKLDIDHCTQICEDLNIDVVPTIIVFENSKVIARHNGGFPNEQALEDFIKQGISK